MTIRTGATVTFRWHRKGQPVTLTGKVVGVYEDDNDMGVAYTVLARGKTYYVPLTQIEGVR
jgi:hypothetical protein